MLRSSRVLVVVGLGLICSVRQAGSLTVTLPKAELSAETRTRLAETVCGRPFEIAVDTISGYSFSSGLLGAYVACQPHTEYQGNQIFGAAECEGRKDKWKCEERWLNLIFTAGGYPKSVRLADVPVEEATRIIEYLAAVPVNEFSQLWSLERVARNRVSADTPGYRYELARLKTHDGRTYEITQSWQVDR
jgi:hypothetical protein